MKRIVLIVSIGVALVAAAAAAAALLPITSGVLGGGAATVAQCDANGFSITYTTSAGKVTSVAVGGIKEPNCAGGSLSVTLVDTGGASVGTGGPVTVPSVADPASVSVSLSPQPAAATVAGYRVAIAGP